jgi:hypothetical protein
MILMRMCDDDSLQPVPLSLDKAQVRQNEINARNFIASKTDPAINKDPFPLRRWSKAVKRSVHSDLAETAQGTKY